MTSEIIRAIQGEDDDHDSIQSAIELLVLKGFSREAAEELVAQNPPAHETDLAAWAAGEISSENDERRMLLQEHHQRGIPPFEPPER